MPSSRATLRTYGLAAGTGPSSSVAAGKRSSSSSSATTGRAARGAAACLVDADADAAAVVSLPPSRLNSIDPTVIVSPSLTEMAVIFPPAGDGMGAMALSDSSSRIV